MTIETKLAALKIFEPGKEFFASFHGGRVFYYYFTDVIYIDDDYLKARALDWLGENGFPYLDQVADRGLTDGLPLYEIVCDIAIKMEGTK